MGNFFDSVKQRLADFGTDVATQSKMISESVKIKSSIQDEEKKLAAHYQALGRAYYARTQIKRQQGEALQPEDISYFEAIDEGLAQVQKLQEKLVLVQAGEASEGN